ncbi:hypothetical protein DV515_00011739 [Chloebia gouldiae]|uniref:CCHC-type domain-containing protein n=1 Tax=Chloebia gouldiae TaxID=44316 RepID=A0A3L8S5D5_CHLGU|nr:hypothetical protein DV515_00011739 [Chloebia gouldiae]
MWEAQFSPCGGVLVGLSKSSGLPCHRHSVFQVCFHCREPGHGVADCPAVLESQDMGTGICYRCGSTEHDLSKCRAKVDPAAGGCCKLCGSVEHFKKDCPEKQNAEQVTVGRWSPGLSADHEDVAAAPAPQGARPKRPKVPWFRGLGLCWWYQCGLVQAVVVQLLRRGWSPAPAEQSELFLRDKTSR